VTDQGAKLAKPGSAGTAIVVTTFEPFAVGAPATRRRALLKRSATIASPRGANATDVGSLKSAMAPGPSACPGAPGVGDDGEPPASVVALPGGF